MIWHDEGAERSLWWSIGTRDILLHNEILIQRSFSAFIMPNHLLVSFLIFRYISLYFVIFPYFSLFFTFSSIVTKFVVSKYSLFSIIILTSFIITFSSLLLIYLLLFMLLLYYCHHDVFSNISLGNILLKIFRIRVLYTQIRTFKWLLIYLSRYSLTIVNWIPCGPG